MEQTIRLYRAWICWLFKTCKQFFKWHWCHVRESNIIIDTNL